jgi:hypothetical protein
MLKLIGERQNMELRKRKTKVKNMDGSTIPTTTTLHPISSISIVIFLSSYVSLLSTLTYMWVNCFGGILSELLPLFFFFLIPYSTIPFREFAIDKPSIRKQRV